MLDLNTLRLISMVNFAGFAFVTIMLWRLVPQERSMRDWATAPALLAVGMLLMGLRGAIPDFISIVIANTLIALGIGFMHQGARHLFGLTTRLSWKWAAAGVTTILCLVAESPMIRIVGTSLIYIPIFLALTWLFWKNDEEAPLKTTKQIASLVFAAGALLFIYRAIRPPVAPVNIDFVSTPSLIEALPYLYSILLSLWISLTLMLIVSVRLQFQRQKALSLSEASTQALKESEEKFRLLTENAKEVIWILCPRTLRFQYVSPAVFNLRGYTPEEVMNEPMDAALSPEGSKFVRAAILQDLNDIESGKRSLDVFRTDEIEQPCKDGSMIWTEVTTNYFLNKKTNQYELRGVTRDITKRKQIEKELQQSEIKFRSLFESTSDAVQLLDDNGFFDCNRATLALFGCTDLKQFCSLHPADLSPVKQPNGEDSLALANQYIAAAMKDGSISFEWTHKRFDTGEPFSAEVLLCSMTLHGKLALQATVRDITKRKQMEDQIRQLAYFDTLTKLPNRRLLNDRLTHTMAASKRSNLYGAMMFLDLDNFKPLNDAYGHVVGDLLLIEAANRLKNCVREIDTVARFGGDEFVVMLSELDVDKATATTQARHVADKILTSLSTPYVLTVSSVGNSSLTVEHHCTASIGVAMFINHDGSQEDILKSADMAMYQAKEAGRNLIRFYENNS